jgi:hypothetical protein
MDITKELRVVRSDASTVQNAHSLSGSLGDLDKIHLELGEVQNSLNNRIHIEIGVSNFGVWGITE